MLIIDFETRSNADLTKVGTVEYARDLSTEILCVAFYDMCEGKSTVIDPETTDLPSYYRNKLETADFIVAHNATFDREIYNIAVEVYGFPEVAFDRWYCSSAQMRVNALPASLEDACLSTKVVNKKDFSGSGLIKKMCIPPFEMSDELMKSMMKYCLKDVKATADIMRATRLMTATEHSDWHTNERVNMRGVRVDVELASLAQSYAEEEQSSIAADITKLTNGVVTKPTQFQRIKEYVLDSLDLDDKNDVILENYMAVMKGTEKKHTLDKGVRESVITAIDAGNLNLYEDVEALIRLLDNASAASVSKFKRMIWMAGEGDRVRGAFVYYGASQTGRYASRGLQLHNMKRDCFTPDQADVNIDRMRSGLALEDPMQRLSKLLRPALIPDEGNVFVVGDWSSIEARALPWLAYDNRADAKLQMFRDGVDVYVMAAKRIGVEDRQIGKVAELSLGYGGASGAFTAMAKNYGVVLPEYEVVKIVRNWRRVNIWAVDFWRDCENAAIRAVRSKGKNSYNAGRVCYSFMPELLGGTLVCELPNGSTIQYPYAKLEHTEYGMSISCLKAAIRPKKGETEWGRVRLWGGLMVENICQAFCAALLRDKVGDAERYGLDVVAHVHDEIICESKKTVDKKTAAKLQAIMETVPDYAEGLPLSAEPVVMRRYGNH